MGLDVAATLVALVDATRIQTTKIGIDLAAVFELVVSECVKGTSCPLML